MAKRFVNLNRFKHGRAIKRNSKQRAGLQRSNAVGRRKAKFRG